MSLAFLSEPAGAPGGKGTQEGRNSGGRVCVCVRVCGMVCEYMVYECVCMCTVYEYTWDVCVHAHVCGVVCGCMVYECVCVYVWCGVWVYGV